MEDKMSMDFDDVYARCRLVFDADLRSPSECQWTQIQNRLAGWQAREYGVANLAVNMTLGIVEELGELAEATTGEAIDDAVADVTIYASQLATCYRLDLGELVRATNYAKDMEPADWLKAAGRFVVCQYEL